MCDAAGDGGSAEAGVADEVGFRTGIVFLEELEEPACVSLSQLRGPRGEVTHGERGGEGIGLGHGGLRGYSSICSGYLFRNLFRVSVPVCAGVLCTGTCGLFRSP